MNKPEKDVLAVGEGHGDEGTEIRNVRRRYWCEPDFGVISVDHKLAKLLVKSG